MKKSNIVKNSTVSGNFFLLSVAIMLPFLMVLTSLPPLMPFSFSSVAFASHGGAYHDDQSILDVAKSSYNNNQVREQEKHSGVIGNMISQQQSPQVDARNVNVDDKVIIVENCEDSEIVINDNDQIIQTNTQSFNQEANNQEEEEEEEEGDG
jgi:hypothetical protein